MAIVRAHGTAHSTDDFICHDPVHAPSDSLYLVREFQANTTSHDASSSDLEVLYGPADSLSACVRGYIPRWGLDRSTGEITHSFDCHANECPACRSDKVQHLSGRIYRTRPDSFFTLTAVPPSWAEANRALTVMFRSLRRRGFPVHVVYALERNPASPELAHIHGYGSDLPPLDVLSESAERVGLGHRVDIRAVGRPGVRGFVYPWKAATWNDRAYADFRALNGSRLYHASQGWLSRSSTRYSPPRRSPIN